MICWSCKHLGWHFVCFKKLTACNPGDSLRMLAGWAWRVVSVSARVIWFMLSSGTLHGNATHSFQGIVSSDGKLHGPLQHGELQLHTHNSPACSWNTPLSESQNRDVILDSYCSLSCLFLSLFFFQIHPMLATVIPHLDSCNSDVTGIMITLISQTLSVIPLSWDAPPTPSSSLANISWCFRTQLRCHLLLETFPYLLRLNLVLLLSLLVCVGVHMHAHARVLSLAFLTPWTVAHRVPLSMEFPGKSTGVSSHFFLQGIFPTQGSSPHLLHLLHL